MDGHEPGGIANKGNMSMCGHADLEFLRKTEDFEDLGASNNYQGPLRSSAEVRNSFATTRATSGDPKAKPRDATATFEPPGLGWRSPIKHSADVRTAPLARARSFETSLSVRGTFDEIANRRSGDQTGGLLS
nr:hypothetical protein Itr_chr03CG13420 [Ipomoea trifida]